jgi:membrane protein
MNQRSRHRQTGNGFSRFINIFRRFSSENMLQTSAALAFTTLLAIVPLAAVVLAVAGTLPVLDVFIGRLDGLLRDNLLPAGASGVIAGGIARFSRKAQQLTELGIIFLGVTAFFLVMTIERVFNHLWRVKARPVLARLRLYLLAMVVWPFLMGAVAVAISFAVSTSLGLFDEPAWVRQGALQAVSMVLMALFFSFLYHAVPNAVVPRGAALVGGVFTTLAFSAMQKLFEIYLASSIVLTSVYGAFSAIPVFLVWLHLSWAVVLFGGLIVATLSGSVRR